MRAYAVDLPPGASGPWTLETFVVPERSFANFRLEMAGRGISPGTYTRLCKSGTGVFMSDTPAEWRDCAYFVQQADGAVLISGLGLGMVVKALLAKATVTHVTVLENDPDVIALVAPYYADERLRVVEADAFAWKADRAFDWAWHDIWPDLCTDNIPEFSRLRRRYAKAMTAPKRQHCWSEPQVLRQRRHDQRSGWW